MITFLLINYMTDIEDNQSVDCGWASPELTSNMISSAWTKVSSNSSSRHQSVAGARVILLQLVTSAFNSASVRQSPSHHTQYKWASSIHQSIVLYRDVWCVSTWTWRFILASPFEVLLTRINSLNAAIVMNNNYKLELDSTKSQSSLLWKFELNWRFGCW